MRLALLVLLIATRAGADSTITVRGDRAWSPTGVRVKRGQQLVVTARGTVTSGAVAVGPDGAKGTQALHDIEAHYPLASAPPYALIARIDKDPPILVGASAVITATHDGELLLGINDDQVADNKGEWFVSIAPPGSHAQPPAPPPDATAGLTPTHGTLWPAVPTSGARGTPTTSKPTSAPADGAGEGSGTPHCLNAEDHMWNGGCYHCFGHAIWDGNGHCTVPPGPVIAPPADWQEKLQKAEAVEKERKRKETEWYKAHPSELLKH